MPAPTYRPRPKVRPARRLQIQALEERTVPATFPVTTTADSGAGSLRQALLDANANPDADTITFDLPGPAPHTIRPMSALPAVTYPVTVDGWSAPDFAGVPVIELRGTDAGAGVTGLTITGAGCTVRGLVVNGFAGHGILITGPGASGNVVAGDYVGTTADGMAALPNGQWGVIIIGGASNNRVGTNADGVADGAERNVLSGNVMNGVIIHGVNSTGNVVAGNFIGTDMEGKRSVANGMAGVAIWAEASGNRIGTNADTVNDDVERNVISGNGQTGVVMADAVGNIVAGNYIGPDASGLVALGNGAGFEGVCVMSGSRYNRIGAGLGANTTAARNVISGNSLAGVTIGRLMSGPGVSGEPVSDNIVAGNFIGADPTGAPMPNGGDGVLMANGTRNNTVGGSAVGAGNLVVGNAGNGVTIVGPNTKSNTVAGNEIRANAGTGVAIAGAEAVGNTVAGNTVVENGGVGVSVNAAGYGLTPERLYDLAASPESVAAADFNHDGKLDAVTSHGQNGNFVSVLLGHGDGTFSPPVTYGTGVRPTTVAIGDFNADGNADLVTTNYALGDLSTSSVSILLGRGDGTFQAAVNYGTGGDRPSSVAVADFDRDGRQDLVVSNAWGNNIVILVGRGDGTFMPAATVSTWSGGLNAADLNGDGKLDLVVSTYGGQIAVLFGNGNGTFSQGGTYTGIAEPYSIAVADLSGDGLFDLAVADASGPGGLWTLRGNGDGTFQPPVRVDVGSGNSATVGDFNGDGHVDVAWAIVWGDAVAVSLGNGDGTFLPATFYNVGSYGGGNYNVASLAPGDFNGDGALDLVAGDYATSQLTFLSWGPVGNSVRGNWIGIRPDGGGPHGNAAGGIRITAPGPAVNMAGGTTAGAGNVIAYNSGPGLSVLGSPAGHTAIRGNAVFGNTGLPIDLSGDGATANDPGDADTGPNGLLNFPVLTSVVVGATTRVRGTLDSPGNGPFQIDFFANPSGGPSRYLGSATLNSDGPFDVTLATATAFDESVTATVTDAAGDTSEFSGAATNQPPVADAGGPYSLAESGTLTLDASASTDPEGAGLAFAWDVNGDGVFGDATGVNPTITWAELVGLGVADGPATIPVRVRADDGHGGVAVSPAGSLTVTNVAPTVAVVPPAQAVRFQPRPFTLTATDPSPVDQAANFAFLIDWDGNGSVDETVTGPSGMTVMHAFPDAGTYLVSVRARDKDGGVGPPTTTSVTVAIVQTQWPDLAVGGTAGDDQFVINPGTTPGWYVILLNGKNLGTFAMPGGISVYADGGNDTLTVNGTGGPDTFDVRPNGVLVYNGRTITAYDVENLVANGQVGNDTFTLSDGAAALNGGAGADTLIANTPGGHLWVVTAAGAGTLDGRPFTGVERLTGGAGDDMFAFRDTGSVSGPVAGGAGTDVLDFSAMRAAVSVNLQTRQTARTGAFVGIERVVGSSIPTVRDQVIGPNTGDAWRISGPDTFNDNSGILFIGFESIAGGSGNDSFAFTDSGSVRGTVAGGLGTDTINYSGRTVPVSVILAVGTASGVGTGIGSFSSIEGLTGSTGADFLVGPSAATTWTATGPAAGKVGTMPFVSFERWQGGTAADTFQLANGSAVTADGGAGNDTFQVGSASAVTVGGGAGSDTVIGPAAGATWLVNGPGAGSVGGVGFAAVETVAGGTGPDTFRFLPGGQIARVDGGAGTGTNTLDFGPFGQAVTINLAQSAVISGTANVVGAFVAMQTYAGSAQSDTLIGPNPAVAYSLFWTVTGFNSGTLSQFLNAGFSGIENLTGGTTRDSFILNGGSVTGTITGTTQDDLRYYTSASVSVNLATGLATGVGRLVGIQYVFGGAGNDTFIGGSGRDSLYGGAGDDFIDGGLGNDLIVGEAGQDIVVGGSGADEVYGDVGYDMVVGGGLTYVNESTGAVNLTAITALLGEWSQAPNGFLLRSFRLLGELTGGTNGPYVISAATVVADRVKDTLRGGSTSRDCLVRGLGPTDFTDFQSSLDEVQRDIG